MWMDQLGLTGGSAVWYMNSIEVPGACLANWHGWSVAAAVTIISRYGQAQMAMISSCWMPSNMRIWYKNILEYIMLIALWNIAIHGTVSLHCQGCWKRWKRRVIRHAGELFQIQTWELQTFWLLQVQHADWTLRIRRKQSGSSSLHHSNFVWRPRIHFLAPMAWRQMASFALLERALFDPKHLKTSQNFPNMQRLQSILLISLVLKTS